MNAPSRTLGHGAAPLRIFASRPATVPQPGLETEAVAAQDQQRKRPGNAAALRPYQIKKGEVRNPTGRPKVPAEVREAAMALTPDAIRPLGEIMMDRSAPPATRVTAADKLLDRALGKPAQQVDVTSRKETLDYSLADLLRIAYGKGLDDGGSVIEADAVPPPQD